MKDVCKNVIWDYGETGIKVSSVISCIGTYVSYMIGGWDNMIETLLIFMGFDCLLGLLASAKLKNTDSKVMFWGGLNKLIVLLFVSAGNYLDMALALQQPIIRTATIWFYIGREGLSMVENCGKLGVPLPAFFVTILNQLKDSGDKGKLNK